MNLLYSHEEIRFTKKLAWFQTIINIKKVHDANKVKKLTYFCFNVAKNSINDLKFSIDGHHHTSNTHTYKIKLDPVNYNFDSKLLLELRDRWLVNISKSHIPNKVIRLLLSEGFCLPPNDPSHLIIEYIKHIENNLSNLHQYKCISMFRSQVCSFMNQIKNIDYHKTEMDHEILKALSSTKDFIKNNPDIIFTRADKGNTVVAFDRINYNNKMETLFCDTNTYTIITRNPVNKLRDNFKKQLLKRWLNHKYISFCTYSNLNSSNSILPRAYCLPRSINSLRLIVSSSDSLLHNLADYLQNILSHSLLSTFSHIRNSVDLAEKLANQILPDDFLWCGLFVHQCFSRHVLDILDENWHHIQTYIPLPKTEFILAIKFVLQSTFFHFNQKYYKQTILQIALDFAKSKGFSLKKISSISNLNFDYRFEIRGLKNFYVNKT